MLRDFLYRLLCRHDYVFERNIYGDEINWTGFRSWWRCRKCGALKGGDRLYLLQDLLQD